jgi:transglutaminase-like putative cysteine protease
MRDGRRRTFEVTARIQVLNPEGHTRLWVPAALARPTPYQQTLSNTFSAPGGRARLVEVSADDSVALVAAEFDAQVPPVVSVTSRVVTMGHAVDVSAGGLAGKNATPLAHFLRPTKLLPLDGVVRDAAQDITRGARRDVDKARAIYDWIVENTYRDANTLGCGLGDIRFMLQTRSLGGKCADLNALFVGLARAAGLPARDVYGLRVAPSEMGYASLGASSSVVTKAQHCRAEVYISDVGWVPVDPADVRKVMLEEPPGPRSLDDDKVRSARRRLFGSWEMNWIAYNFGHDVVLPGAARGPLPFLMYPQAETGGRRLDSLDPDQFKYEITARAV